MNKTTLARKIADIDKALKAEFKAHAAPIIELIEAQTHDPFCVLVGTILSARTKDACTTGAVKHLFAAGGSTIEGLERIPIKKLEKLIFPVGFYHDKARHLKALPKVLREKFKGVLPHTVEELCELPGVGRKTANLTVAVGFNLPAICVDVHVHRISNRLGLVRTKTPFETEMALRELLPVRYWKTWNSHLVSFGQTRCGTIRPRCEGCPIARFCGVKAKPKKAYLFDMDGVLADNCSYHVLAWLEFAKRRGGKLTRKQIIDWMGATGRDYLLRMFDRPLTPKQIQDYQEEKEAIYREMYRPFMAPRKGLLAFLKRAEKEGVPCAVVTGGSTKNVDFILDGLKIRQYFSCIVESSQYTRGKPAPDCYLKAAARVGVPPRECVVFEDAINGIEAAHAARMRVVALTGTNRAKTLRAARPDQIVDSFEPLM